MQHKHTEKETNTMALHVLSATNDHTLMYIDKKINTNKRKKEEGNRKKRGTETVRDMGRSKATNLYSLCGFYINTSARHKGSLVTPSVVP